MEVAGRVMPESNGDKRWRVIWAESSKKWLWPRRLTKASEPLETKTNCCPDEPGVVAAGEEEE